MAESNSLYNSVVEVTKDYLGPAAGRFIDRQIVNHLDKKPGKLNSEDMKKLTEWIKVAFSILTDDQDMIDEYFKRLNALTRKAKARR
jgi:hypothetical protein